MEEKKAGKYQQLGTEVGALVDTKQAAYGDSFGKAGGVMRILDPNGVLPEQLDDALTVVRVVDKLFRIATDRDALGESPWRDVAGYALLSVQRVEAQRADAAQGPGPAVGARERGLAPLLTDCVGQGRVCPVCTHHPEDHTPQSPGVVLHPDAFGCGKKGCDCRLSPDASCANGEIPRWLRAPPSRAKGGAATARSHAFERAPEAHVHTRSKDGYCAICGSSMP